MRVLVTKNFEKDFKKLPANIQKKVKDFRQELLKLIKISDYDNNNLKELSSSSDIKYFRLRVGNYRLGFSKLIDEQGQYISFQVIKTRNEIYKYYPPSKKKRKK